MSVPTLRAAPSPNFNSRAAGKSIGWIILHYTGMPTAQAALARLRDPAAEVSAHYMIDRDGAAYQLVDDAMRAWHAGLSCWRGETDMNSVSLGIELVNPGHQFGYEAFPEAQIAVCAQFLKILTARHAIPAAHILAHSDIAPQRKEDPGELFPWEDLARQGYGFWPRSVEPEQQTDALALAEARRLLRVIGYDCAEEGDYDVALRRVILAFQRRWLPQHLSGLADARTAPVLRAVAAGWGTAV